MEEQRSHKIGRLLVSPAAATTVSTPTAASLPDDIVFEVLSRLPVKSLCRFRCVSKVWGVLIADPAFDLAHRSHHSEPFLVVSSGNDLRLMDMEGNVVRATKGVGGTDLVSTGMEGLVCVITNGYACGGARVINPATGEVLEDCPKLEVEHHHDSCHTIFGFGRAVPSGKYKVVRLVYNDQPCEVFTVGDDTGWRPSQSGLTYDYTSRASPVSHNGIMYFLRLHVIENDKLLCFDLETEELKNTIEGPPKDPDLWKRSNSVKIFELNNALCMVRMETGPNYSENANVWLFTTSEENPWIKAYTISMPPSTYDFTPLRVTPDGGKLVFYYSIRKEGGVLRVYDPSIETCTTLCRLDYRIIKIGVCSLHLDDFVRIRI